jgi:hypothetical protein
LVDQSLLPRLFCSLLSVAVSPNAKASDDAPDLDFLAYLGSWQDSDEEWLIVDGELYERVVRLAEETQAAAQRKDDENET